MPKFSKRTKSERKYCKIQNESRLSVTDLMEGTAQLTASGLLEATELVEAVHKEIILQPFKILDSVNANLSSQLYAEAAYDYTAGRFYDLFKCVATFSGNKTAHALRTVDAKLPTSLQHKKLAPPTQRLVSAINGIMGDHLVELENPLAIPMHLYNYKGRKHPLQHLSEHVVILVHGLCLNHLCWRPKQNEGLGKRIKDAYPKAHILYLNYNTGRRISNNGEDLSNLLQKIVETNPQIKKIDLIGHSMGGLVSRSAIYFATKHNLSWLDKVDNYIALCAPHHGALLELIGFYVQDYMSKIPVAGNFARLGNLRSAGIIDLRHGNIRHQDWQNNQRRLGKLSASKLPAPLPQSVKTYLVAATMDKNSDANYDQLTGDGLVSVLSALGEHYMDYCGYYSLKVPPERKVVFYDTHHMNVLHSDMVHDSIIEWIK